LNSDWTQLLHPEAVRDRCPAAFEFWIHASTDARLMLFNIVDWKDQTDCWMWALKFRDDVVYFISARRVAAPWCGVNRELGRMVTEAQLFGDGVG
jgi:hypothetical protein